MVVALVFVMVVSAIAVFAAPARGAQASPASVSGTNPVTAASSAPTPAATSPRTLKMGWIAMQIGTTNPIHITLDDEYPIVYNVYSTLITYDPEYNYMPDLALKWWVHNSTAYEMYLAPNAYFIDPRTPNDLTHRVTGYDVKWSYETFSQNVDQMDLFTDYVREVDSVWVDPVNPFHIMINFKIPYAPAMETFGTMFILPKYIWQNETLAYSNPLPIGSGPFMVRPDPAHPDKMLKPPPVLYLDKNPHWHGPAALGQQVFPDVLEIDSYTTSAAMSQDLVLGVIDTIMSPEPTEWVYYLADKPGIIRQAVPHAFVAEVGLNLMTPALRATNPQRFRGTNSPLLQNQVVRVAIQMITNRQKMIDNALLGLGEKADTLVPKVSPWHYDFPDYASTMPAWQNHSDPIIGPYTADEEFPDNTDAAGTQSSTYLARALLMKEGWKFDSAGNPATLTTTPLCKPGGTDCLVFRFYTLSDVNWWKTAADGMVADAAKAGIVLNLALYGTTQMNNQIWWPMDYDIWLWDWMFTPAADPSTGILAVETCENLIHGTSNDNGFCLIDKNTGRWVYDDLYNLSVRETDPEVRRGYTDDMQSILYQYGGYSLPFYRKEVYAMNELRWTHWGNWASQPGLPEDVGTNALIGQYVWPIDHKPPQVANLPAYTGVAGHPVQFSTVATDPNGVALTYNWDFADAMPADDTNHDGIWTNDPDATTATASWTYANPGVYNVTLRVSETGTGAEWFTVKRTTATIVAAGTGSPVVTGLAYGPSDPVTTDPQVAFSAGAYDPAGLPMTYTWDFGDGSTAGPSSAPTATHQFPTAGVYTVKVRATSSGGYGERSTILSVAENVAPVVSPLSNQQVTEGNLVTLTGFASDPNSRDFLAYSWDFGDGSASSALNPVTHTYSVKGGSPTPYTVTLTVTDTPPGTSIALHSTSVTALITVIPRGPNQLPQWASFTAQPASATTTQDVTFTLTAQDPEGDPLHWSIDFACSAGNPSHCYNIGWAATTPQTLPGQLLSQTVTYRYTTSGSFRAVAFVDDGPQKGSGNITQTVNVQITANNAPSLGVITAAPASPIPGEVVTLSSLAYDQDGDPLSYTWTFGDSAYDTGTTPGSGGKITVTHTFAALGTYHVTLSVDDGLGGTAESALDVAVTAQNRPPTVSAITAPHYALVGATISFSADVADLNGDTLSYSWDYGDLSTPDTGTTPVPETLTASHVFTAEGTFTVNLSVDDGHGGTAWSLWDIIASNAPPVDVTPPVTTCKIAGVACAAGWHTASVTVTLSATDDISTVAWTNYSIDAGAWTPYTGPFSIATDGDHILEFNSTDSAGNDEATHSVHIQVDQTAPWMSDGETGSMVGTWYTGDVTVTLDAGDDTSGLASATYRLDAGSWQTYTVPFVVTGEGHHLVEYRASDAAGWTYSYSVAIDIDLQAPTTTPSAVGTVGANGWYTSALTVSLTAVDSVSGVSETDYRVDGGAWTIYAVAFPITGEGAHTLEFNSTDHAGHTEATLTLDLNVDTVAPTTTASPTPSTGWYGSAVTITLSAVDDTSGFASTSYRVDGGLWQTYSTPVSISTGGSHTLEFNSTDNAGNIEATKSATIKVDLTGPTTIATLSGTAGANGWYTGAVTVTLAATDTESGSAGVWYSLDGGALTAYSTGVSVSTDGTHTVEYNATDAVGNVESVKTTTVKIDTTPPTATLTPSTPDGSAGWYKTPASVTVGGADDTSGVATREYRIDSGTWQTTAGTFTVPEGTHSVAVRVTDSAGLVSSEQSATIKVDATAPTLTGLTPTGTVSSGSLTLYWTGSDSGSGIAGYSVKVDAAAAQSVSGNSTALTLADGAHTIVVSATDVAGNTASQTLTLTVSTTGPSGGGLDTMTIVVIVVVVAAAALGAVWFLMRRKKAAPPT